MSNHGGKREGAGRPAGSATKQTREVADKLAEEGDLLPLEAMVRHMRLLWTEAETLKGNPDKLDRRLELMAKATDVAAKVAPYLHPRLSAVEQVGDGTGKGIEDVGKASRREVARRLLFAVAAVEHTDDRPRGPADQVH